VSLKLKDYTLFEDGSIEVEPSFVASLVLRGVPLEKINVTEMNEEVEKFNQFSQKKIGKKEKLEEISFKWSLPDHYKYMNVEEYLLNLSEKIVKDDLYEERLNRLAIEIELFKNLQLEDVLKVIIFVVDEFTRQKVTWGVGRGSSCSSYILYLIGLHDIDPVLYDIEIHDFLRQ